MTPIWKRIGKAKRGHAFFEDLNTGRVAIADASGSTPERTEDGILWLDPTRPLRVSIGATYFGVTYPVLSERDGRPYHSGDGLGCLDVVLPIWHALGGKVELEGITVHTLATLLRAVT
jgi:hypothetical protein